MKSKTLLLLLFLLTSTYSLSYGAHPVPSGDSDGVKNILAFQTASAVSLDRIIDDIADKKVIYIGEIHNRYEHHLVQLYIIEALHKRGIPLAIGMEMFERQQQQALDDYIAGVVDERTFLKTSRYFEVWNIDYPLYQGIINFARTSQIPIVGLNIDRKIVSKVSKEGLSSLSQEEKQKLPQQIDLSDQQYRKYMEKVFQHHNGMEQVDNFYQAQVLWDESMAEAAHAFMKRNPQRTLIILAGGGHIANSSGIPSRLYRRNNIPYATILNAAGEELGKGVSDFILFPTEIPAPPVPKLMISVADDKLVKIADFLPNSAAQNAGLKKNDIIVSVDKVEIKSLSDLKIFLLYKSTGDSVNVEVRRKRFLLGEKTLFFNVPLTLPSLQEVEGGTKQERHKEKD